VLFQFRWPANGTRCSRCDDALREPDRLLGPWRQGDGLGTRSRVRMLKVPLVSVAVLSPKMPLPFWSNCALPVALIVQRRLLSVVTVWLSCLLRDGGGEGHAGVVGRGDGHRVMIERLLAGPRNRQRPSRRKWPCWCWRARWWW